mmetsp:Transcript_31610/g.47657  ORF Transcript_31610/g.47657 Transcript_31610/m.47657 type:complete len:102 (-) Transcript_31610:21-326(-)
MRKMRRSGERNEGKQTRKLPRGPDPELPCQARAKNFLEQFSTVQTSRSDSGMEVEQVPTCDDCPRGHEGKQKGKSSELPYAAFLVDTVTVSQVSFFSVAVY